ncbi:serine O-acetyltransferase [Elusimicrobiota bacterium]
MFKTIKEDIGTVFKKDPAVKNILEVILCYPGLWAIWSHRIAHWFYLHKIYTFSRVMSHLSRFLTGIEIHPGAKIGRRFFIDHGMGVVIGETAEIGDDVLIYQGVVLGGTSLEKKKRHPTLRNGVVVGAGAIVLGSIDIGDNSRIGAGSVVISDVPSNATVVGVPGKVGLGFSGKEIELLEHGKLPDPIADALRFFMKENEKLQERVKNLETLEGVISKIDERIEEKRKEIEKIFAKKTGEQFLDGEGI